ncbi:GNAT family N-acetyltransferase [Flammeovirga aprica]|uniref:GNAT family N-acetyltransferase n=1 Tax=Flammeovirga aprica JL-4 TaxID=694437 RepID=A0A7X9RSM1_9BACT|nr:GNAT family protein [Flammeovirga aprica]NME67395.1 GNAT family N-acetyltransferase [Flammeovirga aprica JL-4]
MGRRVIALKPLSKENVTSFYQWLNDPEVIRYSLSLFQKLNTEADIDFWYKGVLRDTKTLSLGIYVDEEFVGYAGISSLSSVNKSGEYYIFIGNKDFWSKGVGTEVTRQIIEIAFVEKELERLMLTVSVPNQGGVKAYKKAGFKEEGRLRNAALRDGEFHDKIIMSILKSEYKLS